MALIHGATSGANVLSQFLDSYDAADGRYKDCWNVDTPQYAMDGTPLIANGVQVVYTKEIRSIDQPGCYEYEGGRLVKYEILPGDMATNYDDVPFYRYADVLLMNAEAKVRKGQNGDAPLNLVRERAGLAPIANATLDQILEERQVELALEWGERFFDLVRTDRATQELPGFVKGESEYYPIPQDQIDLNPNLEAEPVPFEPEVTE